VSNDAYLYFLQAAPINRDGAVERKIIARYRQQHHGTAPSDGAIRHVLWRILHEHHSFSSLEERWGRSVESAMPDPDPDPEPRPPVGPWQGNNFAFTPPYQFLFTLPGWPRDHQEIALRRYREAGYLDVLVPIWQELRNWNDGRGGRVQYPAGSVLAFNYINGHGELATVLERIHAAGLRSTLMLHSKHRLGGAVPLMDRAQTIDMWVDCLRECRADRYCVGFETNLIPPVLDGENDHRWAYDALRSRVGDGPELYDHFGPHRDVASKHEDTDAQRRKAKAAGLSGYLLQTYYTDPVKDTLRWVFDVPSPHGQEPGIVGRNAAHGLTTVVCETRRDAAGHRQIGTGVNATGRGYGYG